MTRLIPPRPVAVDDAAPLPPRVTSLLEAKLARFTASLMHGKADLVIAMLIKSIRPATLARELFICWAPSRCGLSATEAGEMFDAACRAETAKVRG